MSALLHVRDMKTIVEGMPQVEIREETERIIETKGLEPETERFRRLIDANWNWMLAERPELATWVGAPGHDHRWSDQSFSAIAGRKIDLDHQFAAIRSIDRDSLDIDDQLNFDLLELSVVQSLEAANFPSEYMPIGPMGGPHSSVVQTIDLMASSSRINTDNILARIEGIAGVLDQSIALMRAGIEAKVTVPRILLRNSVDQISSQIVRADESPVLRALSADAADPSAKVEAEALYNQKILPALEIYRDFVSDVYVPACRESTAFIDLPEGDAWYDFLVKKFTTTDLSPSDIHEIGTAEVDRIRSEMEGAMRSADFSGSFEEFFEFLRTDDRFYYEDSNELLRDYRDICKRADAQLPRFFRTLPRLPYGVSPIPSYIEKATTTAYYQPGSLEAGRAAQFFANTYDLRARPKWEMEALTLHEAVPGHHLQIALAQELDLPAFRRHSLITAFIEGWGLYAESLGTEMGFYADPYSLFGRLTYEIWRAIRLVVDTGMHALGWSRDRAISYFAQNAGKAEHDIIVEIDRYLYWPGQALAYKIGELKIRELRSMAESKLGDSFDIRTFHDELLKRGALPLDFAERFIRSLIKESFRDPR